MIRNTRIAAIQISDLVPESKKLEPDYLAGNIDYWIGNLVRSKPHEALAYQYYHGVRDSSEFKYLEDNYGIGNACDLKFVPLVRKHIEVLKGMLANNPLKYRVNCSDSDTLESAEQMRHNAFLSEIFSRMSRQVQENMEYVQKVRQGQNPPKPKNSLSEEDLAELSAYMEEKWISGYEANAQDVIDYILQSKTVAFRKKLVDMFEDYLVSGTFYYRGHLDHVGEDPKLEVCHPLHTFISKNRSDMYMNQGTAAVHRFYRTPEEIVNQFGHLMSEEEVERVLDKGVYQSGYPYYQYPERYTLEAVTGLSSGLGAQTMYADANHRAIECYHVEWLANNKVEFEDFSQETYDENGERVGERKVRYRMDRYSGYRIGPDIYVGMGKDDAPREPGAPYKCRLSYNGMANSDRNGVPYSLVLMTKDLQDKYDIYHFLRDNVVHNAGGRGLYFDHSMLPTFLGDTEEERALQAMAYAKQGYMHLNTSQEGVNSAMNTLVGGFDLSLDYNAVQGYNLLIDLVENTVSTITGVPRQMLGIIEQRDAVTNVEVGIRQGLVITRPMFLSMEMAAEYALSDMLRLCQKSFRKGKKGSIMFRDRQKSFDIMPDQFCHTDYNVHIVEGKDIEEQIQTVKSLTMELVKAQAMSMDAAFDILRSNSLSEATSRAKAEVKAGRNKNLEQMNQQLQQMNEQLEKAMKENESLKKGISDTEKAKLELDRMKIQSDIDFKNRELESRKKIEEEKASIKKEQVKAELAQLFDASRKNNEIKNI